MGLLEAVGQQKYFDITSEMNLKLESMEVDPPPMPDKQYRISGLSKLCAREEVLRHIHKVEKKQKIPAKLKRTFDFGRAFHTQAQAEWFGKWGWLVGDWICQNCRKETIKAFRPQRCQCGCEIFEYREFYLTDPVLGITGHLDGIIFWEGEPFVLELKTTNSMQYKLVTDINRRPIDAHVDQVVMYMFLTGIKRGKIVYMDKNESLLFHFDVEYMQGVVDRITNEIKMAREGMVSGVVPKRTTCGDKNCSRAKSCPVRGLCFGGEYG